MGFNSGFKGLKSSTLYPQEHIYVFYMDLRTNSDSFPT